MRKLRWKPTPDNDTLPLIETLIVFGVIVVVTILILLIFNK